jgi:hypothetical protein
VHSWEQMLLSRAVACTRGVTLPPSTTYLGSFDPSDIQKNFLGDTGFDNPGPNHDVISFNVPADENFVVVVTWAGPHGDQVGTGLGYDPYYWMWVRGCGEKDSQRESPVNRWWRKRGERRNCEFEQRWSRHE